MINNLTIGVAVVIFLILILVLVAVLLFAKNKLTPSGELKININDGFNLKGVITHETSQKNKNKSSYSYNYNNSKLLRGLYIDNNLYTISETAIKVNNLDTLELIDELKIK